MQKRTFVRLKIRVAKRCAAARKKRQLRKKKKKDTLTAGAIAMTRIFTNYLLIAVGSAVAGQASAESMTDAVGCVDQDDIKVLRSFAIDKKMDAFRSFYADRVSAGKCVRFYGGEPVAIVEVGSFLSGLTKVQPASGGAPLWVMSKFVK